MKLRPYNFSTFWIRAGVPILFLFILAVSCSNTSSMNQQPHPFFSVSGEPIENSYTGTADVGHASFILKNQSNSSINVEVKEVTLVAGEQQEALAISSIHVFDRNEEKAMESPVFKLTEASQTSIFVSFPAIQIKDTGTDVAIISVTFIVNNEEYTASSKTYLIRRIPARRN